MLSAWSQVPDDDYREAITEVFGHFPLAIVDECADPWYGIARTKTTDGKSRRFPPSAGEVAEWLDARADYYHKMSAERRKSSPLPPLPSPNVEDVARVQAIVRGVVNSCARVLGRPTDEDRLAHAGTVLERLAAEKRARDATLQPRSNPICGLDHATEAPPVADGGLGEEG
jgi:hypothetical protein